MQLVISSSCRAACLAPSAVTAAMRNRCEGQRHDRSPCILLPPSPPLYFAAMHAPSSPALSHHQFVLGGAQCVCSRRFASTSANEKETFGVNSAFQGGSSSTTSSTSAAGSQDKRSQRAVADANFNTNCPFATLGLSREATKDEVREQYLQLSMIHHPDKGGQSWKFKRVNSAYKQSLEMIETGYAHKTASEKAAKSAAGGYSGSSESTKTAGDSASSSSSSSSQHQHQQRTHHAKRNEHTGEYESASQQQQHQQHDHAANGAGENSSFRDREWFTEDAGYTADGWERETTDGEDVEREFESEEGWAEFRDDFFRNRRAMRPEDVFRFKFSQATTTAEIDHLFKKAMDEKIFSGYDIGLPLYLALERYHLGLGLGETHVDKCFATMQHWESMTERRASSVYYQVILKLYTNDEVLSLFPHVDSTMATDAVWKVLQRMQDNDIMDESGIAWWETLRLALMNRIGPGNPGASW